MAPKLSHRRFIKASLPFANLEITLVGFFSASLVLVINYWGTGYVAWYAALIRFTLSIIFHAFITKAAEHLTHTVKKPFLQQLVANFVPNTLFNAVQYALFLLLAIPRPFWSVFPFWLISLFTFSQIVKSAAEGYEPGIFDIVVGLYNDARRLPARLFARGARPVKKE